MTYLGHTDTEEPVDVDVRAIVEGRLLITGSSGAGKSYVIRKLLETTYGQVQHIVFDCEGDFVTLREKYDYLLVGNNGDLSFDPERGDFADRVRAFAQQLRELRASVIIDLSDLRFEERDAFIAFMLDALIEVPRKLWNPCFVVIDEAHLFAPQNGSTESLSVVKDLMTRGRKRGLGGIPATQRLSELNKTCAEVANKLIGRTGLDVDQKRAAGVLGLTTARQREGLALLPAGTFWAYGPAFDAPAPRLVTIDPVETRHPQLGDHAYDPPPAPEGVREILAALASGSQNAPSVEEAKSEPARTSKATSNIPPRFAACDHLPVIVELNEELRRVTEALEAERSENNRVHEAFLANRGRLAERVRDLIFDLSFVPEGNDATTTRIAANGRQPRAEGARERDQQPGQGAQIPPSSENGGAGSADARSSGRRPDRLRGSPGPGRLGAGESRRSPGQRSIEDMTEDEARDFMRHEIARQMQTAGRVLVVPPAEVIRQEYQRKAIERVMAKVDALGADEREAFRYLLSKDVFVTTTDMSKVLSGYVSGSSNGRWSAALKNLLALGVIGKGGSGNNGYKPKGREMIAAELTAHSATDAEVDEVYQAVLGRIAGASA